MTLGYITNKKAITFSAILLLILAVFIHMNFKIRISPFIDNDSSISCNDKGIAFVKNGDIYSISADGSGLKQLTNTRIKEKDPVYSPNGSNVRILYKD